MFNTAIAIAVLANIVAGAPAGIVGSTQADAFPPTGTEVDRDLFPDRTVVGFPHVTRTGAEPAAYYTAPAEQFPKVQQAFGVVVNPKAKGSKGVSCRGR